jgi:3-methyladenine DNA glycosylase AlkC
VDRAALDLGMTLRIPVGGWCPKGRKAEDGRIPEQYPLQETDSEQYAERTRRNVCDSDGTLILYSGRMGAGTDLTRRIARELSRPLLVIDLDGRKSGTPASQTIRDWLQDNAVTTLNVAGPRESSCRGVYAKAFSLLKNLFEESRIMAKPRKGALRRSDIPAATLAKLNSGELESRSLAEGLAVDFRKLLMASLPDDRDAPGDDVLDTNWGIVKRMSAVGSWLNQEFGPQHWDHFAGHSSDTVRGWAAYMLAAEPGALSRKLHRARGLADDPHFGVREWAWLALRPAVAADVSTALSKLRAWTSHASPNIRRFASEITRPCGVWCAHLTELKVDPEPGRIILEPLKADPSKYVQDSVANWLNDASKSNPDWVRDLCADWSNDSPTPATLRICHRALRSLRRAASPR